MKKLMIVITGLLFTAALVLPAVASDHNKNHGYDQTAPVKVYRDQGNQSGQNRNRNQYKADDRHDQGRHYDYRHYKYPDKGYRNQPYGRHYDRPYKYKGHEYRYYGHWISWNDWERYQRMYPKRFHHGSYYHDDGGHLFFGFCDPDTGAYFFYSIGR